VARAPENRGGVVGSPTTAVRGRVYLWGMGRRKASRAHQGIEIRLKPSGEVLEAGVLAWDGLEVEYPRGYSPASALALVEDGVNGVRNHEAILAGSVAAARSAGCSWRAIAQALGVTHSSALERFSAVEFGNVQPAV